MYIIFVPLFSDHSVGIDYAVQDYVFTSISDHIYIYILTMCACAVHSNLHAVYIILYCYNIRNNAFLYLSQGVGRTKTLCARRKK